MRTTTTIKRSGRGPRVAIGLSLLVSAAVLAAAFHIPSWLSRTSPVQPDPGVALRQAQLDRARPQAALVAAEDTRLLAQLRRIPWKVWPYWDWAHPVPTLVLTARPDPYTLDSLLMLDAVRRIDVNTFELINSVLVGPGAQLSLNIPGTTLRMTSTPTGFTSLVGWKGAISITGAPGHPVTVTSWDPVTSSPDQQVTDGRAYLRVAGSSLHTHHAAFSELGFWSGRTGGLAITGSESSPGTGSITQTTVHADHYGLFSSDTQGLTIADSTFDHAAADGILFHEGSTGVTISTSTVRGNVGSGIVANRGASDVTLRTVTVERNGADGIRFDGRPLADRPGAAGASLDGQRGFGVHDSTVRFNAGNGVLIWDADDAAVTGTALINNFEGIVVRDAANRIQISANTISSTAGAAIAARDGATDVAVSHNTIVVADTGIQVRGARAEARDNTITAARLHGVSFQGAAHGSAAHGNTLAGSGPSALDLARLDAGAVVSVATNSVDQWEVTMSMRDRLSRLFGNHPLLAIWMPLLLSIVASLLGRRRRRRGRPAHPYPDHPAALYSAAPIRVTGEAAPAVARSETSASPGSAQ